MRAIKDKVVVVTGSTRGYRYTIAESLLEAGAAVTVTGRTQQAVDRALASLQPKGRVSGFVLDVRNEDQVYRKRISQNTYRESMNNKRLLSIILVGGIPGLAASVESATRIFAPVFGGALLQQVSAWAPGALGALIMAGVFVYVFIRIYNHPIVFTLNQESAPVRVSKGD